MGEIARVETVRIGDHEIQAVRGPGGEGYAVVRRMCEALGIDHKNQREKLQSAPWACGVLITSRDVTGRDQELYCLHVRSVAMWLATIDANRVSESARPTLVQFQREAADALYRWAAGAAVPQSFEAMTLAVVTGLQSRVAEQSARLAIAEPKAEAFTAYVDAPGALSLRDAAKHLGRKQDEWIAELLASGKLYRQRTRDPKRMVLRAYAQHVDAGWFVLRFIDGLEFPQVLVTRKGLEHFMISQSQRPLALPAPKSVEPPADP